MMKVPARGSDRFPAALCDKGRARGAARSLAGIRADGATSTTFPKARAFSGMCIDADEAVMRLVVRRTVAGAARLNRTDGSGRRSLPV
jgi:hypothetical protein